MNMKMIAGACLCTAAIVGCVSVEQTRQQLQSKDSAEVKNAEANIYRIATEGRDPSGFVQFTPQQQVEYVDLTSNNDLLLKILDKSYQDEVTLAAAKKLDFTKEGLSMEILTKHKNIIGKVSSSEKSASDSSRSYDRSSKNLSKTVATGFKSKVFAGLSEQELKNLLRGDLDVQLRGSAARRLLDVTQDPIVLYSMVDGDLNYWVSQDGYAGPKIAANKLSKCADKLNDEKMVIAVLDSKPRTGWAEKNYVLDVEARKALLSRLTEEKMVEYALQGLEKHSVNRWNADDLMAFYDAITVAAALKDTSEVVRLVSAVLAKLDQYKEECSSGMMSWEQSDKAKASKLKSQLPTLTDEMMVEMLCVDATSWRNYIGLVSPDVAYKVLVSKKAKTPELELELLKKVPSDKLDVSVYDNARADVLKKAIYAKMTPAQQKLVREANEKAFAGVIEKAKIASKDAFELEGFYLGMSWEDMKIVLAHHFPELEAKEKDDDGLELYVSNQKSAFCFADKEKKIYQFNFGKKMLKKWYKYDVQDYAQWASAYSRAHKIDMQYKMVEKEATVYEPMDMSRSYKVWFYQHSYQYKHNAKEYRLTYFGDEKDFTVHGGIGGAAIKSLAAPKFRYTRGDPGSLRVRIEKD